MIFTLNKSQNVEIPDARTNLSMLLKGWTDKAINDNSKAIRELKALDQPDFQKIRQQLVKAVYSEELGSANHAAAIVDGLLNFDSNPYQEFLKDHFKNMLSTIANGEIDKHLDQIYTPGLNDFISGHKISGALGQYFFSMKKLGMSAEKLSAAEFTLQSHTELEAKIIMHQDKTVALVEKDEIGLVNHLNDLSPQYHQFMKNLLLGQELGKQYNGYINTVFRVLYQNPTISNITSIINSAGKSIRRAA